MDTIGLSIEDMANLMVSLKEELIKKQEEMKNMKMIHRTLYKQRVKTMVE